MLLDYTPVLLALILILFFFGYTFSRGVVGLMSSGLAALCAMVVFFTSVNLLPVISENLGEMELTWQILIASSAVLALLCYIVGIFVFKGILKFLFNPDSWLHSFADGIPGAILSIVPSAIAILFFFCCIRIVGTVQELNYSASISQSGIEAMGGKVPPVPMMVGWRNGIERVPFVGAALDILDPFSNRLNRRAAAFLIMTDSVHVRSYLLSRSDTKPIAESLELNRLRTKTELRKALKEQDRLGVVLDRDLQQFASDSVISEDIEDVRLKPVLEGFVDSLPKYESAASQ
ncbi:MAG: hypothetical protein CMO55_23580 [Verrucomicrobiales bacterium]|nr:hypothetical protein [Verrucomicrobiales bacterium]